MSKNLSKEDLFENYFETASKVFPLIESVMGINGVCKQLFGQDCNSYQGFSNEACKERAKNTIRKSDAWQSLSWLYDYSVDGVLPIGIEPEEVVIGGAEVLSIITTENYFPSEEWDNIVSMGDGRFALDTGEDVLIEKLALLASVHVRTVRNAISAGELKSIVGAKGHVDNVSARNWLSGRRGFLPTRILETNISKLVEVSSAIELAAFLRSRRDKLGLDSIDKKLIAFHPLIRGDSIADLENGVFKMPLDTVFPLADMYQLDRNEFLSTIMRVFFMDQLSVLTDSFKAKA